MWYDVTPNYMYGNTKAKSNRYFLAQLFLSLGMSILTTNPIQQVLILTFFLEELKTCCLV